MKEGTIAHCEILTPELFWDEYYLQTDSLHPKQKEFIDNLIAERSKSERITPSMVEKVYRDVYTKPKEGDGMILYTKLENHIKGLWQGKEPITMAMRINAEKRKALIEANSQAMEILEMAKMREEEIYWEMLGVRCKAKIDANGVIEEKKKIILADIKIGTKPMSTEEAIEHVIKYDYVRQLRYYDHGMRTSKELNMIYDGISEFAVERYIIHVDPVVARVIPISNETAIAADKRIEKAIEIIKKVELTGVKQEIILPI